MSHGLPGRTRRGARLNNADATRSALPPSVVMHCNWSRSTGNPPTGSPTRHRRSSGSSLALPPNRHAGMPAYRRTGSLPRWRRFVAGWHCQEDEPSSIQALSASRTRFCPATGRDHRDVTWSAGGPHGTRRCPAASVGAPRFTRTGRRVRAGNRAFTFSACRCTTTAASSEQLELAVRVHGSVGPGWGVVAETELVGRVRCRIVRDPRAWAAAGPSRPSRTALPLRTSSGTGGTERRVAGGTSAPISCSGRPATCFVDGPMPFIVDRAGSGNSGNGKVGIGRRPV